MQQVVEREIPLYTIKCYNDCLYRVVKRLFDASSVKAAALSDEEEKPEIVGKFDSALSRAKNLVRELALCNQWDYFVTLTFDSRWDRYDFSGRISEFLQWVQNENKTGKCIRYLLVPEFHKDGAVHLHALMSGIAIAPRPDWWPVSVNRKDDGSYYDCWSAYSARYGFSAVEPVRDICAVGFYISKYITKTLCKMADMKGVHTYYRSHGLRTSLVVGTLYHNSALLDKCCKFENSFYRFGFCKFDDVGSVVDMCDEVSDMYQNYVITDPVTDELIAFVGGDSEDEYVQEVISAFREDGQRVTVYDFPD